MILRMPLAAYALAALFGLRGGARSPSPLPSPSAGPTAVLRVPRAPAPIDVDGALREPIWTGAAARTGAIATRPFSEARLAWRDGALYVALYAADRDITSRAREPDGPVWLDDAFRLLFTADKAHLVEVSPLGVVTDAERGERALDYRWQSGAQIGRDLDGTANDPHDEDEEWVLELALPLQRLGVAPEAGAAFHLALRRCDASSAVSEGRTCAEWEGELVLD